MPFAVRRPSGTALLFLVRLVAKGASLLVATSPAPVRGTGLTQLAKLVPKSFNDVWRRDTANVNNATEQKLSQQQQRSCDVPAVLDCVRSDSDCRPSQSPSMRPQHNCLPPPPKDHHHSFTFLIDLTCHLLDISLGTTCRLIALLLEVCHL